MDVKRPQRVATSSPFSARYKDDLFRFAAQLRLIASRLTLAKRFIARSSYRRRGSNARGRLIRRRSASSGRRAVRASAHSSEMVIELACLRESLVPGSAEGLRTANTASAEGTSKY